MSRFNMFMFNHAIMILVKLLFIATVCLSFLFTFWLFYDDYSNSATIYRNPAYTPIKLPLLIDENCLLKIPSLPSDENSDIFIGNCSLPLKVAINSRNWSGKSDNLQIAWIMEEEDPRKDFWLFNKTGEANGEQKALKRFATRSANFVLRSGVRHELAIPQDVPRFLRHWRNGRFIPCRVILRRTAWEHWWRVLPLTMIDRLAELAEHMDQFNVTGFLMSGTLLGWRRECSLIPHTADTDMGILAEDHSSALLQSLLHSRTFKVTWIFGHPRRFLELSGFVDNNPKHKIDVFYLHYNTTRGQTLINAVEHRQRYIQAYPGRFRDICTGQMGDHLFFMPCNHDVIIESDYGPHWKLDVRTNEFIWNKSPKNMELGEKFGETEMEQLVTRYEEGDEKRILPTWD